VSTDIRNATNTLSPCKIEQPTSSLQVLKDIPLDMQSKSNWPVTHPHLHPPALNWLNYGSQEEKSLVFCFLRFPMHDLGRLSFNCASDEDEFHVQPAGRLIAFIVIVLLLLQPVILQEAVTFVAGFDYGGLLR